MLLVDDILFSPFRGILWIFREIRDIAQKELDGEAKSVTEQLQTLYMQLETGRITEAEFEAGEKRLLDRLDAIESRMTDEDDTEESEEDETEESEESGQKPDET